jgi:hypothetical protein
MEGFVLYEDPVWRAMLRGPQLNGECRFLGSFLDEKVVIERM